MEIYIKGMEMPKTEFGSMIFAIRPDGMVEDVMGCYVGKAVPVPPHGRLIDADDLANSITGAIYHSDLRDAPTIIPASGD